MKSRGEMDGFKALAVLSIVLFHYDVVGAPGGFVCIDVLLVVCGFLITSDLHSEVEAGTFNLLAYYERGMRRLLPALLVLLAFVLGAGLLLMKPPAFVHLAKSGAFASLASSNVFYALDTRFFSPISTKLPLLHTWSVACVAQFYILLPILIVLMRKASSRIVLGMISGLAIASFVFSLWYLGFHRTAAFYMLPSRLWELLIGSLVAFAPRPKSSPTLASVLGLGGLAMILLAITTYNQWMLFPGKRGLLPVLGAMAVLYSFRIGGGVAARLLAWKPIAFVGKISFSWFLWHWPLIAFYKYLELDNGSAWPKISLMVISFGLAVLSWRFVEKPFLYRGPDERPLRPLLVGLGGSVAAATAFGLVVLTMGGPISPASAKSIVASQSR